MSLCKKRLENKAAGKASVSLSVLYDRHLQKGPDKGPGLLQSIGAVPEIPNFVVLGF